MNLKPIAALIALSLAGCGNKGPLVQAAPPPVEGMPAEVDTTAPAETAPVESPPADDPPAETAPAEVPPPVEVPETDTQDG